MSTLWSPIPQHKTEKSTSLPPWYGGMTRSTPDSRRRRSERDHGGRDTYHLLTPEGEEVQMTGYGPKVALLLAEEYVQRNAGAPEIIVRRRSVLGPSIDIYRIVRGEHRSVRAVTLEEVD